MRILDGQYVKMIVSVENLQVRKQLNHEAL